MNITHFSYLIVLLLSLGSLVCLDLRYRLVLFRNAYAALQTISFGVVFFIAWDLAGINLHIFFIGNSRFMTHWQVVSQFPVEELFFLILLVYLPLLAGELLERRHV